jgi:protein TonB
MLATIGQSAMRDVNRDRIAALTGVVVLHALFGYLLLAGFKASFVPAGSSELKTFVIIPPEPRPEPMRSPAPKTPAAKQNDVPRNRTHDPVPVAAPPAEVHLPEPTPIVAAPAAGGGRDILAGASSLAGPGTGAGGDGSGGGGGAAVRAERVSGALLDRDYPVAARQAGIEGTVFVRFEVDPEGRVRTCDVTRSSGSADLDSTTCRLIKRRFRYRPARDRSGKPIAESVTNTYDWRLGRRPGN